MEFEAGMEAALQQASAEVANKSSVSGLVSEASDDLVGRF